MAAKSGLILVLLTCWWTFVVDRKTTVPPGDYITDFQSVNGNREECQQERHRVLVRYRKAMGPKVIYDSTGYFKAPDFNAARYVVGPCLPGGLDKDRAWYRWGPMQWLPTKEGEHD